MWNCNKCGDEIILKKESHIFNEITKKKKNNQKFEIITQYFICKCSKIKVDDEDIENIAEWEE